MGIVAAIKAVVFVASVVYQNKKQQQLKKKQEQMQQQQAAAEEARKGFTLTVSGEAVSLPVVYGKNFLGGIAVKHRITSTYKSSSITGTNNFNQGFTNTTASGTKNEFLHVQHALCHDGIESVVGVKVNNLDYNDADQRFNHLIRTYRDGGAADPIASANGIPSTNRFTGTAYASSTFKLDRDDPQYNGSPEMGFLVKGRKVRRVNKFLSVYSLSSDYSYSNNPALCLLDYLLNADFGRGLSTSEVDLQSFYEAAIVCGRVVTTRAVGGVIYNGVSSRSIPLYECNITLSTSNSVRDNIEAIMNTMALSELTWSSEGKYKLLVECPTTLAQQNALVDADHYFTDDDIVRDDVIVSWPSASERYNQVTITYSNEHEDFKSDSATWPKTGSTAYNTYLTEDNNQPFRGSFDISGITDPYHALAAAEQFVREARSVRTIDLTVTKKGLSIEPGDFINITSATSNISDEVYRVQALEVNADFTVKLTCAYFNYATLAWNVNDDIAYSTRPVYDFKVEPVTGLTYTAGSPSTEPTAVANLTWTAPTDGSFKCVVYARTGGTTKIVGETTGESFHVYPEPNWSNGQSVTFIVKSQTPLGRLSTGVSVAANVVKNPMAPTSLSVDESLYQTNKASGVKARATLSFSEPSGGVAAKDYRVEYYRDQDGSTYRKLGFTVGQSFPYDDVRAGDYHFRIIAISWLGFESTALIGTAKILGLSALPSDPTGLLGKATDTGILLTWDTPTDLDVVSGGTTEIRYVRNDVVVPKWEIAQVIANNISGSTTTATLPVAPGYYLIKHIDSSGNACVNHASWLNSFVGPEYNAVATVSEDPTFVGTKTNCGVTGGNLELSPDNSVLVADYDPVSSITRFAGPIFELARSMTYLFDNSIDLGSVENIRLSPRLTALITDGTTVVADYDPVSSITRFAGPLIEASISFEVRTTNDDPAGSPVWSDWETFTVGNYRNRAFEFRLNGFASNTAHTISISELSLTADKADVYKRGTSVSSSSADTTVAFNTGFYGGIGGTDIPYVGCNTVGGASSDIVNIVNITKDGFDYSVYDNGVRVVRAITWQAVGQ